MEKGKKMAALVGCNYTNTKHELHGCINDVLAMKDMLVSCLGFEESNIEVLTDETGSPVMPTGVNIMDMLNRMVDRSESGDVLFFHYSGHGTRIPSNHGFKHDEAIVPCDFNLITDVDFRRLVNRVPEGSSFTIISDSCHSGGLIDKEKEQIGPSVTNTNTVLHPTRPKIIPFESILSHLSSLSGIQSSEIGHHLTELFGNEASMKFHSNETQTDDLHPARGDSGILLSGCQANETSADINPSTGLSNKAYGAFSNSIQMVLKEYGTTLTNREMIIHTREVLQAQAIYQHPCLYCSDENANTPFLSKPEENSNMEHN